MAVAEVEGVARVPLAAAWAWATDWGAPGDEFLVDHGQGRSLRRVVAASPGRVRLEERLPRLGLRTLTHEVEVVPGTTTFVERGLGPLRFESVWSFEAVPGGTRVRRTMALRSWWARWAPPAWARPAMRRDLLFHLREMERDLSPAPREAAGSRTG